MKTYLYTLAGGMLALFAITLVHPTSAQERSRRRLTAPLILATLAWSEAGLACEGDASEEEGEGLEIHCDRDQDMLGIHAVLLRGVQHTGLSYRQFAANYARRVIGGHGSVNRAWLRDLRADGSRPSDWPEYITRRRGDTVDVIPHQRWGSVRELWLAHYTLAETVVENYTLDNYLEWGPCSEPPDDWGSPRLDHERAVRLGLIQVTCTGTRNEFWLRPSRATVDVE